MDTSLRIAVVGAGPSGLTAAYTLKRLGYSQVTVFERNDRVGGKVDSIIYQDRSYELGAYVVTEAYHTVLGLAIEHGLDLEKDLRPAPERFVANIETGRTRDFGEYLKDHYGMLESLAALLRFGFLTVYHNNLYQPGLAGAHPSLRPCFAEFAAQHKIGPVAHLFRPSFTSLGYGYYEQIPALYVMKFLDRAKIAIVLKSAIGRPQDWPRIFTGGFENLWVQVASRLDVRLSSEVTSIRRESTPSGPLIHLSAGGQTSTFDRVVIAAPLDATRWFMDLSQEEADLFGRIQHLYYYATLFLARGLPNFQTTYIEQHQTPESLGRTLLISNPYLDGELNLAYHFAADNQSTQQITTNLQEDVVRLGGSFQGVYEQRVWKYFPHVHTADLNANFYERLDALQGQLGTAYVGGLLNFETVEDSASVAKAVVERIFA